MYDQNDFLIYEFVPNVGHWFVGFGTRHYHLQNFRSYSTTSKGNANQLEKITEFRFNLAICHAHSISSNSFFETTNCSKGSACVRLSIHNVLSRYNHSCDPYLNQYTDDHDITYRVGCCSTDQSRWTALYFLKGLELKLYVHVHNSSFFWTLNLQRSGKNILKKAGNSIAIVNYAAQDHVNDNFQINKIIWVKMNLSNSYLKL